MALLMRLIPVTSPTSNGTSLGPSCPSWRGERTVEGARGGRTVPCSMVWQVGPRSAGPQDPQRFVRQLPERLIGDNAYRIHRCDDGLAARRRRFVAALALWLSRSSRLLRQTAPSARLRRRVSHERQVPWICRKDRWDGRRVWQRRPVHVERPGADTTCI